jgi:SAM-dependent methyltransferase
MQDCIDRYLPRPAAGRVLELGSSAKDPHFRRMFEARGWEYVGADLAPAANVDVVLADPFLWDMPGASFDAVISGQMLEHNEMFWLSFLEMTRVLKPGGLMIHIAPSRGPQHRAPTDCWRFYPDGMRALAKWSGLDCLEAQTDWTHADLAWMRERKPVQYKFAAPKGRFPDGQWGDTVGVFRKRADGAPAEALRYLRAFVRRWDGMAG